MQQEMVGKLKIIILFFLFLSCKNKNDLENVRQDVQYSKRGKEFVSQNINTLIDSVERFDMSKIPRSNKFKDVKIEKLKIGLLDSVLVENKQGTGFLQFTLATKDLINFKSEYDISIVKINNYDINTLFVRFSNFKIEKDFVSIDVKKNIGISMIKNRYYFKKENNIWIFKDKKLLGIG